MEGGSIGLAKFMIHVIRLTQVNIFKKERDYQKKSCSHFCAFVIADK